MGRRALDLEGWGTDRANARMTVQMYAVKEALGIGRLLVQCTETLPGRLSLFGVNRSLSQVSRSAPFSISEVVLAQHLWSSLTKYQDITCFGQDFCLNIEAQQASPR